MVENQDILKMNAKKKMKNVIRSNQNKQKKNKEKSTKQRKAFAAWTR